MVDLYGRWTEERDYNIYPKNKWCDMDYMANWIRNVGYEPKTSMGNLIEMVLAYYDLELEDSDREFYTDITESENGLIVSIEDISCYVEENGGLIEFDYYC